MDPCRSNIEGVLSPDPCDPCCAHSHAYGHNPRPQLPTCPMSAISRRPSMSDCLVCIEACTAGFTSERVSQDCLGRTVEPSVRPTFWQYIVIVAFVHQRIVTNKQCLPVYDHSNLRQLQLSLILSESWSCRNLVCWLSLNYCVQWVTDQFLSIRPSQRGVWGLALLPPMRVEKITTALAE